MNEKKTNGQEITPTLVEGLNKSLESTAAVIANYNKVIAENRATRQEQFASEVPYSDKRS